jgi:hypothetical protein
MKQLSLLFLGFFMFTNMYSQLTPHICMRPSQVRLLPYSEFKPVWVHESHTFEYPITSGISWTSSNTNVVTVAPDGTLASTGLIGESMIVATWNGFKDSSLVKVVTDFQSPVAEKRIVNIALIVIDPQIAAAGGQRFSQRFWSYVGVPMQMAEQVRDSLTAVSGGALEYRFTEIHDEQELFTKFGGTRITSDSMYQLFLEPGWNTLHLVAEQLGQSEFLYNDLIDKYDLCTKSNQKQIDEVWVYAMPFIGMWESNMTGTDAFWINGAVITGNSCTDQLTFMGLNYERSVGCALHNWTHRIENIIYKLFPGQYRFAPSDPPLPAGIVKSPGQTFLSYEAISPGDAHIGNGHYPPNGTDGYDYDNPNPVVSFAPAWQRYPFLYDDTETVTCSNWGCEGDCGQNFVSWWMRHIPHYKCKDGSGRLNNWWAYIIDWQEGFTQEHLTTCACKMFPDDPPPVSCNSKGDFPWHEWIAEVKLDQINYPSGKSQYSDFTQKNIPIIKGAATQLQVTAGFSYYTYTEYVRIWADLNRDQVFTPDEQIGASQIARPANGTPTSSEYIPIIVPSGTPLGNYKMRISLKRDAYPEPCETFAFGEVEDYTLEVKEPILTCELTTDLSNVSCSGDRINFTFKVNNTNGNQGRWLGLWPPYTPTGIPTVYEGFYGTSYHLSVVKGTANALSLLISDQTNSSCTTTFTVTCPTTPPTNQYCTSTSAFPWEDWIAGVKLSNLNNASGKSPYSDFTTQTVHVNAASIIGMTLTSGFSYLTYDEYWKVWIDYNQDGVFDNLTESAISQMVPRPLDGTPTQPANLTLFVKGGFTQDFTTRMRVSMKRGSFPNPCETLPFGEVEDYSIKIFAAQQQNTPDLSVTNFLTVQTGAQGAIIPFTFDLVNSGTAIAIPNYQIGAYLSLDNQVSPDDALVGVIPTGNTPIGTISNVQGAITVPLGLATGNYFLILFADSDKQILESNELNNQSTRPFEVKSGATPTNCGSKGIFPWEEWISGVKIGNLENKSSKSQYTNYSSLIFPLSKGATTPAQLTTGYSYFTSDMYWKVWIDYNQNQIFEEPAEQFAQGVLPRPANGTATTSITLNGIVPNSALNGNTKMRVSMKKGGFPTPCEEFARGEVEDYTAQIGTLFLMNSGTQPSQVLTELNPTSGFILAPNPATEVVQVSLSDEYLNLPLTIRVMNQLGTVVMEHNQSTVLSSQIALDLVGLHNGLYFVNIESPSIRPSTQKLVITQTD